MKLRYIKPKSVTYNVYLQLGVDGLRGLQNFNIDDGVRSPFHHLLRCRD